VILRTLHRGVDPDAAMLSPARLTKGAANLGMIAVPALTLYAGNVLASLLREVLTNADMLEKLDNMDDDEWESWAGNVVETALGINLSNRTEFILQRGAARTPFAGLMEPSVQILWGIKYDNDLTRIYAGAYQSFFAQQAQNVLEVALGRNAAGTKRTEYNAAKAFYQGLIKPVANMTIASVVPARGLVGGMGTAAIAYMSRYSGPSDFADKVIGDPGKYKKGEDKFWTDRWD